MESFSLACNVHYVPIYVVRGMGCMPDFHGRWGAVVMSESNPLVLPPKDISYALKNTPETVKQRQLGIQSYFDAAFMMIGRMRSVSQAFRTRYRR